MWSGVGLGKCSILGCGCTNVLFSCQVGLVSNTITKAYVRGTVISTNQSVST